MYEDLAQQIKNELKQNPFSSLYDLVYKYLREYIIHAKILPGDTINISQLADILDFSRTPINEAIQKLTDEGYIKKEKGKHPVVNQREISFYEKLITARVALEKAAAKDAAKLITTEGINKLRDINERYGSLKDDLKLYGDIQEHARLDHEFHWTIMEESQNPFLIEGFGNLDDNIKFYRYLLYYRVGSARLMEIIDSVYRHHVSIINALNLGLSNVAAGEIAEDIDGGMQGAFNRHISIITNIK